MNEDTIDIALSEADFDEMDVSQLKRIYDKLRQSRQDMKEERDQMKEKLAGERDALQRMTSLAQHLKHQAQERDARLARVAMRMIDQGLLDTMTGPKLTEGGE